MSYGISIRSTSGYVTDPAGSTYIRELDAYPTARGGRNIGWDAGQYLDNSLDRDDTIDPRLAGAGYRANGGSPRGLLRVDLPDGPGTYPIGLALGDALTAQGPYFVEIWDDMTPVALVSVAATTGAAKWRDATGVELNATTWPTTNATINVTVASSILRFAIGDPAAVAAGGSYVSHIFIGDRAGGTPGGAAMHYYSQLRG